ncbi:MAG: hypothetical protein CM1200mP13_09530 [Candidatus Pelagibacterales bacterium]|nr:MAG: hypothetical protein CM1200mP13_09530 [Pelagibacterales bacterium]
MGIFDKKLLLEKAEEADNIEGQEKIQVFFMETGSFKRMLVLLICQRESGNVLRKGKTQSQNAEIVDL